MKYLLLDKWMMLNDVGPSSSQGLLGFLAIQIGIFFLLWWSQSWLPFLCISKYDCVHSTKKCYQPTNDILNTTNIKLFTRNWAENVKPFKHVLSFEIIEQIRNNFSHSSAKIK